MAEKDERGRAGEERAAGYLTERGYVVVDRNWRSRTGELDIVATHGVYLVAVEVKTRRSVMFGHPFEAVTAEKLRRLWKLCHEWRHAHPEIAQRRAPRVDAVAVVGDDMATAAVEHLQDLR